MSERLKDLAMRIRNELPEIEHTLKRAKEGVQRAKKTGDDYYLDGVALNLHSFYSGIERVFELIATNVDDMLPEGENWQRKLDHFLPFTLCFRLHSQTQCSLNPVLLQQHLWCSALCAMRSALCTDVIYRKTF